jgi:dTDP-4-amino-4,6-dideoxygalactose transaminase
MPVHMAGLSVDMPQLAAAVAGRGIHIIEDAAHALPTRAHGHLVGSTQWSTAAVFSFYATKTVTTGEGGMVTMRDPRLADRIRVMRLHGIDRDVFRRYRSDRPSWSYDIVAAGFKYNMPDTAAAMGRVQLQRAGELRDKRSAVAQRYFDEFADLPVELPARAADGDLHAWHLFIMKLDPDAPVDRDRFIELMSERGVTCSVHFIPLHQHTHWREVLGVSGADFPQAAQVAPRAVSLPLFSSMTQSQVDQVVSVVREILA